MQQIDNPPNRFERLYLEWEVEPPVAELKIFEDQTRSILSENDSPDLGFRYSVNPYRGCTHACAYCYARPSHEYLGFGAGTDFDSRILIKPRAPELLAEALARPSWRREVIVFSGDTDCYQPIEAHYRLTRRCLEACLAARTPVGIVTKSYLITRDRDLLVEMAAAGLVTVAHSIAFADDDMARALEPGTPRPSKRFEAMRELSAAGIPTRLLLAPLIPGLNDDQVPKLLERARANGASSASYSLLRLPGAVREVFFDRLRERLPLRADRVLARLREVRGGELNDSRFHNRMHGSGVYWDTIAAVFELHARRHGLAIRSELAQWGPTRPSSPQPDASSVPAVATAPRVTPTPSPPSPKPAPKPKPSPKPKSRTQKPTSQLSLFD